MSLIHIAIAINIGLILITGIGTMICGVSRRVCHHDHVLGLVPFIVLICLDTKVENI